MEEEKLLRKKKKALNGSNKRVLAEACNDLASFYYKNSRYSDALDEYRNEASICKELGLRLEWATCNRMIGEMYMLMAEFDKALKYEERHLSVAKELKNLVEEQRAMATLGRIYLLQGQSSTRDEESKTSLTAAEKAFMKSLVLCEKLNGKINKSELMDMRARLLLNIGVVQEHMGFLDKALDCINKAITICSNQDLYEVLHNCYTTEALLHYNKRKDHAKALSCLNKALEVASRLEDKVLKMCETLSSKADILCKMSDYQSAKQVLLKAWKLKTPDEEERENIESNLKIVAAMCYTEDLLISTNPTDHVTFKKLYEKLGDGACHVKNYPGAIQYYLKMLDHAELAGDTGKTLIPIYVSLYQTYKDMGGYHEALQYMYKEYELIKDVPKEAYTTLCNIAEVSFLAKKPYDQIEKACLDARSAAREWNKRKYEVRILKNLLKYQEEYCEMDKMEETKADLRLLGYDDANLEYSEDEQSSAGGCDEDTTHIGDDICLEDLTDLSDTNEEDMVDKKRETRRRGKGFTMKKNMKGETQLHVACISGNRLLVERLLGQGHPVNIRDNAGWLPLHEACIHGHTDVARILIDNGANINDRGGVNCDGITPLYDAASNGHLDVVQMLLQNGAIPTLKTDFGETPLQVLQKWRTGTILTRDEEALYNYIISNIQNYIDKDNASEPVLNRSKSKTPVKPIQDRTPPSTSKMSGRIKELESPVFKRRNIIEDDSDDDMNLSQVIRNEVAFPSDDTNSDEELPKPDDRKTSGVKEYRNAISALRNRNVDVPETEIKKTKPKSALLDPSEVDDDWLDDDLGITKNKKRKLSDPITVVAKKTNIESIKESIDSINRIEPLVENNVDKQKKRYDLIDLSANSSDADSFQRNENVCPKVTKNSFKDTSRELNESKSRDSRDGMRRRWKRQSTLLKAGFQRRKSFDRSSNSGSDCENSKDKSNKSPRKSSSDNFGYSNSNDGFNIVQNMNPSVMQAMNVIQPISIVQPSKTGRPMQTQILPPAAVKVKVEDKVLLISLKLETINRLTISWLVEKVKSRYYKLTGVRPVFSLMTSDGAILSEEDPLSLVLASPELHTCISNFKASPAEERYLECCDALGVSPSQEIQQAIGRSITTRRIALGMQTLSQTQMRPLFRALTHQTHITAVMISNNNIGDEGLKYLTEAICTMKHVTHLDISRNNISADGIKTFLSAFEKPGRQMCQGLEDLDVSGNPISNDGFKSIVKLSQYLKLRVLKLNNCGITEVSDSNKSCNNFDTLEVIDLSNNDIRNATVNCILTSLNPNILIELELDNIRADGTVVGCIANFMDTAKDVKIRRLGLSKCKLVDSQFMRIFRSLGRARNLQSLSLRGNNLTFIALKKLLQRQPPVPQINLEGCQDIFKYSPDSDFQVWLPAVDFGRCIPEINVTPVFKTDEERDSYKSFSKTWLSCFKGRGMIEHCDGNVTKFTAR
ncbi:tonsoku-like protein [Aricia agestis]|uniref:tonsoku-like protein n=1 Tax=Aricia agestis TaxID=91739 RepID=UPI001C202A09|nr:tonsoku-like protein [Aricia agestis]XP_041987218.1 tonsoku-like protein [Aricia agestis]XP_041987219.1 tonsoku-like protein [Aricia agestis]